MQAIILAGGFGTRLQTVVKEVPKPLAPINGKPFLYWLITYLKKNGVDSFIFSLGYLHQLVEVFLEKEFSDLKYQCIIEKEPLGTGGAIRLCLQHTTSTNVLIVNGDSFFNLNINAFFKNHTQSKSDCSIALKPMQNFDRYGSVIIDSNNSVTQFNEKKYCANGLINTGILIFNRDVFLDKTSDLPLNFSYEKHFLEPNMQSLKVSGYIAAEYFIDIGIPEDYYKADKELALIINGKF